MNDPTDLRRRQVLAGLGALGFGALTGCAPDSVRSTGQPGVDPAGSVPASSLALPKHSIDVHAHFFNASDASVIGYLTHSMSHHRPKMQSFLEAMHDVLKSLIRIAPTARDELDQLRSLSRGNTSAKLVDGLLSVSEDEERKRIATAIARQMAESGVTLEFGDGVSTEEGFESVPTDEEDIYRLLDPDSEDSSSPNKMLVSRGPQVAGVFRFLGCMLQRRSTTLRTFRRGHGKRGISAAFGALVDFDHFYHDLARSPLGDQVELHSLLARHSGGFMLPLFPYNPWADIKSNGSRLSMLTEAVENRGFIGAKIYPPVGFRPANNTAPLGDLDPNDLNTTLQRFFSECNRLSLPVMAHANSTQGRDHAADHNSHPDGWDALIKEMASKGKVPLLNLGHFGGADGVTPDGSINDWPVRFAQLMKEQGGQGIYGDLGYWTALRECGSGEDVCDVALRRLAAAKRVYPELDKRLMYGSDFFMMIKEPNWKRWPVEIAETMRGTAFDQDRLFHQNAMECFGLYPDGPNRKRLERFFSGNLPEWMS